MPRSDCTRRSKGRAWLLLCTLALVWPAGADAQEPHETPRTVPERTDYERTSSTAEVAAFLDSLHAAGAPIAVRRMGTSAEGRPILLVVASDPPVTSPREAARSGKLVVYVQANIHGGEVEGKEAVQLLLRELAGPRHALLEKLVVLVAPVYNPDGNDAFGPQGENRSQQNGPPLVGRRPDGLLLDLNRDYVKAEAPETRASLARVWTSWDPAVMMDLHATNGTRHGYLLTYSPPLDPNGPPGPTAFAQDTMLPAVREAMQRKHGAAVFPYGNVRDPLDPQAWTTYSPLAWYGTNYAGMRGRIGILSEAYSHADFHTRVEVTHDFVVEVLEYAAAHADDIHRVVREADRRTTLEGRGDLPRPALAVEFEPASRGVEPVVLERMRDAGETDSGRRRLEPTGRLDTVPLPVVDRFVATRTETLPGGYLLPAAEHGIAELLRLHGVEVRRLAGDWSGETQVFAIDSLAWADSPFEGHRMLSIRGSWRAERATLPAATYYVSTAQPLGRLVYELLEPAGYGFARWNLFDRLLGRAQGALSGLVYGSRPVPTFPIWRVERDPAVATRVVATGERGPTPNPGP
ncbi:MAG TPA: M14 family zinc carboxypeptidase [Gemmatimonadota bacterium]|nr:M14 family zinc carboxypeptidase [Gemmatimonadota bacterium]